MIAAALSENDLTNEFVWSHSDLATGNYHVYAVMSDSNSSAVIDYAPNHLKHIIDGAPIAPVINFASVTDSSVLLDWSFNDTTAVNFTLYFVDDEQNLDFNSTSFNVGDNTSQEFQNFVHGRIYQCMITAIDETGRESDHSNIMIIDFVSSSMNNAPSLLQQNVQAVTFVGSNYAYQLLADDPDSDPLEYNFITNPDGMTINDNGMIYWNPDSGDIGYNFVEVKVSDPARLSDQIAFHVIVFDTSSNSVDVYFNQAVYNCMDANAYIYVNDVSLNTPAYQIDTLNIKLSSSSDPTGIKVKAIETQTNSKIFVAAFQFDEFASGNSKIMVGQNDQLQTSYFNPVVGDTLYSASAFEEVALNVSIMPDGPTSINIGDTLILSADAGFESYLWSNGSSEGQDLVVTEPGEYFVEVGTASGCRTISNTIVVDVVNSIEEPISSSEHEVFIIYPNPADRDAVIEFSTAEFGKIDLEITDIQGVVVYERTFETNRFKSDIDVSKLAKGAYIVQLKSADKVWLKRPRQ